MAISPPLLLYPALSWEIWWSTELRCGLMHAFRVNVKDSHSTGIEVNLMCIPGNLHCALS